MSDPDQAIASPARKALDSFERGTLRKLTSICKEYPDLNEEFEDSLFTSSTYGQGVLSSQLEITITRGWVEQEGLKIRITKAGREAAGVG